MNTIFINYFKTPIGEFIIGEYENKICICDWRYRKMRTSIDKRIMDLLNSNFEEKNTPLIEKTKEQLLSFIKGNLQLFDIPLLMVGTDFQKQVWEELIKIPYGKTDTYLSLSRKLNNEKAIRAVASANGANAIAIIIPCHRIIGSDGSLVGYAGGLPIKKKLLQLENKSLFVQQELF